MLLGSNTFSAFGISELLDEFVDNSGSNCADSTVLLVSGISKGWRGCTLHRTNDARWREKRRGKDGCVMLTNKSGARTKKRNKVAKKKQKGKEERVKER